MPSYRINPIFLSHFAHKNSWNALKYALKFVLFFSGQLFFSCFAFLRPVMYNFVCAMHLPKQKYTIRPLKVCLGFQLKRNKHSLKCIF